MNPRYSLAVAVAIVVAGFFQGTAAAEPKEELRLTWKEGVISDDGDYWITTLTLYSTDKFATVHSERTHGGKRYQMSKDPPDHDLADRKVLAQALAALDKIKPASAAKTTDKPGAKANDACLKRGETTRCAHVAEPSTPTDELKALAKVRDALTAEPRL
jgi:hypothetical protein